MFDLTEKTDLQKVKFILGLHSHMIQERLIFEPLTEAIEKIFSPRCYKQLKDGKKENHGSAVFTGVPESAKNKFVRGATGYLVSRQPWWLRMTQADQALMHNDEVKNYLDEYNEQLKYSFNQSTFYKALPHCIEDGVTTGPGVLMPEYNEAEHRVYYKPKSHWRVWIMDDQWGNAAVYHEELEIKAVDALKMFDEDKLPVNLVAQAKGKRGNPFTEHKFLYAIYKNPNHDPESIRTEDLPYIGRYVLLSGTKGAKGSLVEEKGRPWFPIVLRINKKHGLTYNTHRTLAAESLTEGKITNSLGKAKLNAAHKAADPPLWGPKGMSRKVERNAGGFTEVSSIQDKIAALYEAINWPVSDAEMDERNRIIEDKFFVRFFELLSQEDAPQMTAFQASLISGEKAVLMGPVTEPIEEDVLTKAVDIQSQVETDAFLMPDPPGVLFKSAQKTIKLLTEFDGPLTQLRRNLLTSKGTLTGLGVLAEVVRVFPSAARKIKDLELIEDVSIESGAKQRWFRSDEEMLELDREIMQKEEEAAAKEMALEAAKAAPGVSGPVDENSIIAKAGEVLGV
jgi:hypothetical protein